MVVAQNSTPRITQRKRPTAVWETSGGAGRADGISVLVINFNRFILCSRIYGLRPILWPFQP
jgi:hypothetical protein